MHKEKCLTSSTSRNPLRGESKIQVCNGSACKTKAEDSCREARGMKGEKWKLVKSKSRSWGQNSELASRNGQGGIKKINVSTTEKNDIEREFRGATAGQTLRSSRANMAPATSGVGFHSAPCGTARARGRRRVGTSARRPPLSEAAGKRTQDLGV